MKFSWLLRFWRRVSALKKNSKSVRNEWMQLAQFSHRSRWDCLVSSRWHALWLLELFMGIKKISMRWMQVVVERSLLKSNLFKQSKLRHNVANTLYKLQSTTNTTNGNKFYTVGDAFVQDFFFYGNWKRI